MKQDDKIELMEMTMKLNQEIKGILFDSGKVLNRPSSGHWFISPKFFQYVDEEKFKHVDKKKVSLAFKKANEYIDEQNVVADKESEYNFFVDFYKIFLQNFYKMYRN